MELLTSIHESWSWTGIKPSQVVGDNSFGNLIIKDEVGLYWRLCPEDLYCKVVANSRAELDTLSHTQEFLEDWYMVNLEAAAKEQLGPLRPGYKYCLKIPGVLGGEYGGSNLATVPLVELVAVSGHMAREIQDLPNGAQIRLRVTE
jgi:hypothetical protein